MTSYVSVRTVSRIVFWLTVVTLTMSTVASAQVRNSINQGFEDPVRGSLPAGALNPGDTFFEAFQVGEDFVPGWSSTHPATCSNGVPGGPLPCIEIFDNFAVPDPANPPNGFPNSGSQWAELNADVESAALLEDVCLINGEVLSWEFFHRNRETGASAGVPNTVRLQVAQRQEDGGAVLQVLDDVTTFNNGGTLDPNANANGWQQANDSAVITAATGIYDLQFVSTSPTGTGAGNFLDDISLTLTPVLEFSLSDYQEIEGVAVNLPQIVVNGFIPAGGISVPVSIVPGGTTADPSEFSLVSSVSIPGGFYDGGAGSSFPIDITINDDTDIEATETIEISVGTGPGFEIAPVSCNGSPQQNAIYTILDNDARLTLDKTVTNDNGGTEADDAFTLEFDGGSAGTGSGIEGSATVTTVPVSIGTFNLSETGPTGYALETLSCVGAADTATTVANPQVSILQGELVTCTFVNNDIAPRLTITKTISGGPAALSDFTLSFDGPSGTASGISGSSAITNVEIEAGTYTISETLVDSYDGVLTCSGAVDANPNDGLIVAVGEVVTCTFTNTFNPVFDYTLVKQLDTGPSVNLGQNATIMDAGDQITYTVEIENTGNTSLTSFVLSESLPGATITCPSSGSNTIASLGRSQSEVCAVTYTLLQADFDTNGGGDGDVDNTVSANADGGGTNVARSDSEEVPITILSEFNVVKSASPNTNVAAGQTVTYTYRVTNVGNTTISDITLNDNVTQGNGPAPVPEGEQLSTAGGLAVSSTTIDPTIGGGGADGVWQALGPGDSASWTGEYEVLQQDIDQLQ